MEDNKNINQNTNASDSSKSTENEDLFAPIKMKIVTESADPKKVEKR